MKEKNNIKLKEKNSIVDRDLTLLSSFARWHSNILPGIGVCPAQLNGRVPGRKAGDPGSIPGPRQNFQLSIFKNNIVLLQIKVLLYAGACHLIVQFSDIHNEVEINVRGKR